MRLALAYRFTGENPVELEPLLGSLCESLRGAGHEVFCSIEKEEEFRRGGLSADDIYAICRRECERSEGLVVFLRSESPSKGIELEIGDAKEAGKPILLATPPGVQLYREHATRVAEYGTVAGLCGILRSYDFSSLRLRS